MYIKRFEITYGKSGIMLEWEGIFRKITVTFQFSVRMFSKGLGHGTHGVKMQPKSQLTKVSVTQICSMQKYCSDFSDKEQPLVWTPSSRCKGSGTLLAHLRGKQKQHADPFSTISYVAYPTFSFPMSSPLHPLPAFEEKHLSLCS